MTTQTKIDPELAFPYVGSNGSVFSFGMTLRDYFAAKAIQGMCAVTGVDFGTVRNAADLAYRVADAMLEARK